MLLVEKQIGFVGYPNRRFSSHSLFRHEIIIRQKKFDDTVV